MLKVSSSYWSQSQVELAITSSSESEHLIEELLADVERFAALPPLSSYSDDIIAGHHAWLTVIDRCCILHAYFDAEGIEFELYGPVEPSQERNLQAGDPLYRNGLYGRMKIDVLKQVLRLLDSHASRRDYVLRHASEVEVVEY